MKPVMEKILASGLVEKHTAALMEKWGVLDAGAVDMVGIDDVRKMTKAGLEKFTEELDVLLEREEEAFRQTRLDIPVKRLRAIRIFCQDKGDMTVPVMEDEMGRFITEVPVVIARGVGFVDAVSEKTGTVVDYENLHQGDEICALMLTVEWDA